MKLLPDWKAILTRAWSVRLIVAGAALEVSAEVIRFWIDTGPASPTLRIVGAAAIAGALVARLIHQENLSGGSN